MENHLNRKKSVLTLVLPFYHFLKIDIYSCLAYNLLVPKCRKVNTILLSVDVIRFQSPLCYPSPIIIIYFRQYFYKRTLLSSQILDFNLKDLKKT